MARFATNSIDGTVTVETVGFTVSAEATAQASVDIDGDAVLPLGKLAVWLTTVQGRVEVEVTEDGDALVFTTSDAELPVSVYTPGTGQLPPEPGEEMAVAPGVWEAIKRVAFAADRLGSDDNPGMKHMLHVQDERVWATDSYTYAEVAVPGNATSVSFYPETAAVLRNLGEFRAEVDADRRLHLTDDAGRYVLSTYAEKTPDIPTEIRKLIDRAPREGSITFDRKETLDALAALAKVKVADSPRLVARFDGLTAELEVDTGEGTATRQIAVSCDKPVDLGFTLSYLSEALSAFRGDSVTFTFGSPNQPLAAEEDDLLVVLMPVRLDGASRPSRRSRKKAA